MGGGSKMQMVAAAAWIIIAAAAVSVCYAEESSSDCAKRCTSTCSSNPQVAGVCALNCAIQCHWPFSQPTGEVMVTQGAGSNGSDAVSVEAVLSTHPNATGAVELGAAAPGAGDQAPLNIPQNITQMSTV